MEPKKTILIPATENASIKPRSGKKRAIVYSRVIKYTGAGLQIRKKVNRLIANRPDWEMLGVTTDLCETPFQKPTQKTLMGIICGVIARKMEILIIYSDEVSDETMYLLEILYEICKRRNVSVYIAGNDVLVSAEVFTKICESKDISPDNIFYKNIASKSWK
jgi:hypothetical protein